MCPKKPTTVSELRRQSNAGFVADDKAALDEVMTHLTLVAVDPAGPTATHLERTYEDSDGNRIVIGQTSDGSFGIV